jgi:tRNA (guanine37-N1)-methyltransferase
MQFEVFTLLPEVFPSYLETSILKRARERGLIHVNVHNIRDYTHDKHHTTDDTPYGGGGGMVMKPEPVFEAIESVLGLASPPSTPEPDSNIPIILLTPQGRVFNQTIAKELSQHKKIALLCGRYEGIDERIRENLVTDEISIGDYVLTGGELPALILIDAVARLLARRARRPHRRRGRLARHGLARISTLHPSARISRQQSTRSAALRRPRQNRQMAQEQALERTFRKRPDMLEKRS